ALEYGGLLKSAVADRVALVAVVTASPLVAWLAPAHLVKGLVAGVLAVVLVPLLAGDVEGGLRRASLGVFGVVWFLPLVGVVLLGDSVLAVFIAVSLADIAASFGGRLLGGPALSPLSPAKRWSGALAGAVAGLGALAVLGAFTVPLAVAVAVGAPLGDLLESMVKRGARAKDSASWLAGAGGLLDRLDSLLLTLALALLLT
ncbi:phosphatidate cytidylyltransferase, partial [Nonomuraea sp. NPDC049784]|uniref:phosphatidate cytidylyltransferase n=1 Tax=Nonomuraea sp. NPDC049784 TaxID=3154361 RepID=UPI0034019AE8